jgi:ankyrin repeat protein
VNAQGGADDSALEAASRGGHMKVVQTLLQNGADVNARSNVLGSALHADENKREFEKFDQ